jgi:hypothetical protein
VKNIKYIKSSQKSELGFTSIYFIFFTSLLLIFSILFNIVFYASQSKDAFRKQCLNSAIDLEKDIINYEKDILLLNIPSTLLRAQMAQALLALATVPWPANLAILVEIEEINLEQENLDTIQKNAIRIANQAIAIKYAKLIVDTNTIGNGLTSSWSKYLTGLQLTYSDHFPQLSIQPDLNTIAPNYRLTNDYIKNQSVELKWRNFFWFTGWTKKILNINLFGKELNAAPLLPNEYNLICLIQAERTITEWKLEINLDKY